MTLTVGAFCAGYGGIELGLELAGWPGDLAWVAENDPAAAKVLAHHHPNVPNLGDITTVDWSAVQPIDIVTAGFPCQDISYAGKRAGMARERLAIPVSDLQELPCGCFPMGHKPWCDDLDAWRGAADRTDGEIAAAIGRLNARDKAAHPEWFVNATRSGVWSHIAEAIGHLRPSLVVIENVRALLSTHANRTNEQDADGTASGMEPGPAGVGDGAGQPVLRALGAVLGDLADLGFDAEWVCVPASAVGAPHRRERVFILAWPANPEGVRLRDVWPQVVAGMEAAAVAGGAGGGVGVVDLFPTPNAALGRGTGFPSEATAQERFDQGRRFLDDAVALLPTPAARDWKSGESNVMDRNARPLNEVIVNLLPTPTTSDIRGPGRHGGGGPDLRTEVALLPTPRATDGTKGGPNQRGSSGDLMLPSAVMDLLPTPRVAASRTGASAIRNSGSSPSLDQAVEIAAGVLPRELESWDAAPDSWQPAGEGRWGRYADAITRWEHAIGRAAPHPTEPGTKGQPRLSPRFVEWMMGLPAGYVTDVLGRNAALGRLGNGVVPQQCAFAVRLLVGRVAAEVSAKAVAT